MYENGTHLASTVTKWPECCCQMNGQELGVVAAGYVCENGEAPGRHSALTRLPSFPSSQKPLAIVLRSAYLLAHSPNWLSLQLPMANWLY